MQNAVRKSEAIFVGITTVVLLPYIRKGGVVMIVIVRVICWAVAVTYRRGKVVSCRAVVCFIYLVLFLWQSYLLVA